MKKRNDWLSAIPTECHLCHKKIKNIFVDGQTRFGAWALMCEECHAEQGYGLGLGKGQKYQAGTGKFMEG